MKEAMTAEVLGIHIKIMENIHRFLVHQLSWAQKWWGSQCVSLGRKYFFTRELEMYIHTWSVKQVIGIESVHCWPIIDTQHQCKEVVAQFFLFLSWIWSSTVHCKNCVDEHEVVSSIKENLSFRTTLFPYSFTSPTLPKSIKPGKTRRRELTEEETDEIKEAFELFDNDKDNELDYHEFKVDRMRSRIKKMPFLMLGCTSSIRLWHKQSRDSKIRSRLWSTRKKQDILSRLPWNRYVLCGLRTIDDRFSSSFSRGDGAPTRFTRWNLQGIQIIWWRWYG